MVNIEEEQSDDIQSSDTPHAFSGYAATSTQISPVVTDTERGGLGGPGSCPFLIKSKLCPQILQPI